MRPAMMLRRDSSRQRGSVSLRLALWLLLYLSVVSGAEEPGIDASTIIQPPGDQRQYRHVQLDNGLKLLLIADPDARRARVAIDVAAGYNQEQEGEAGAAALLAYSLLEAREQAQPALAEADTQVTTQVTAEHTRFVLDMPAANTLAPQLQAVMAWITAPEFSSTTLTRALSHTDADFQQALVSDQHRRLDVYCDLFQPSHPSARHCQASVRVEQMGSEAVAEALQAYHRRYYVPARFALVVSAPLSLSKLESTLLPVLRDWPAGESEFVASEAPLFAEDSLPLAVDIRSTDASPHLYLSFPVPHRPEHRAYRPFSIASALLENPGPGGVLWLLQDLGWAHSLNVQWHSLSRQDGLYEIKVGLTDLGVRARDQVEALIFYVLEQIRERGLESWRYGELAQLADLAFRYGDEVPGARAPQPLAARLHWADPEQLLRQPYRFEAFDERLHEHYLSYLTSDNVIVALTATDVSADQLSPLLATPYTRRAFTAEQPDIKISVRRKLSFPDANDFIPQRLNVKEEQLLPTPTARTGRAEEPVKIVDNPRFHAWYQQDVTFKVPKSSVFIRVDAPAAVTDAEAAVKTQLFAELLQRQLDSKVYQARAAGFDFSLRARLTGLEISLAGYSSQQGLMLTRVGQLLTDARFEEAEFERARSELMADLQEQPDGVEAQIARFHLTPYWSRKARTAALKGVSFEDFSRFSRTFFQGAFIHALYFGNLYRQEAQRLAALTDHYLGHAGASALPAPQLGVFSAKEEAASPARVRLEGPGLPSASLYVQGPGADAEAHAVMAVLREHLAVVWPQQLPAVDDSLTLTLQQRDYLGYPGTLVTLTAMRTDTDALVALLETLLAAKLPEADWQKAVARVTRAWRQPPDTLVKQGQRLWQMIDVHGADFGFYQRRLDSLQGLSFADLQSGYAAVFQRSGQGLWLLAPDASDELLENVDPAAYRERLSPYQSH